MSKAEIIDELPKLAASERQEILERLCLMEADQLTATHQALVDEGIASGPAQPATQANWQQALERGLTC